MVKFITINNEKTPVPDLPESDDPIIIGADGDKMRKTLNNTGYMVSKLDPYSLEFVEFSSKTTGKAMDIGACYGIATLAALDAGAKSIITTDNEPRHLEILRSQVKAEDQAKVQYVIGSFPNDLHFKKNSIAAILCSRVLHLLRPSEIDIALKHIYDWLEPNGRAYIINDTPYVKFSEKSITEFLPLHEKRKKAGDRWPGYISNIKYYLPIEFHQRALASNYATFMDVDTIGAACKRVGFDIIKAEFIPRPDYPAELLNNGKENAGIIVTKI